MEPPQALQDLDLAALVGLSADEAREAVELAGGVLRAIAPGGVGTADYRPSRVTLEVEDGRVVAVAGRG